MTNYDPETENEDTYGYEVEGLDTYERTTADYDYA